MARTVVSTKPIPEGMAYLEPKKRAIEYVVASRIHLYKPELWNAVELLKAKQSAASRVEAGRFYYSQEVFKPFWDRVLVEINTLTIEDLFVK